jgi:hypothetical protein
VSELQRDDEGPPSGVRDSDRYVGVGKSNLLIALAYWPGRWTCSTVRAALALESDVDRDPPSWAELLDRIEAASSSAVVNVVRFP